jgi:hypothetical protein
MDCSAPALAGLLAPEHSEAVGSAVAMVKAGGSCFAHATCAGVSKMAMAGVVFPELAAACIIALGSKKS